MKQHTNIYVGIYVVNNDVIQPLCVILPRMNGYIKYLAMAAKL